MNPTRVVVVAGLSGAGKSTAVAALEDLGYHAVENLPPGVIEHAVAACEAGGVHELALGFTSSVSTFLESAAEDIERLATTAGRKVTVLFLDASDEALVRRFSETRRPHPLLAHPLHRDGGDALGPGGKPLAAVLDGIALERERLAPLRGMATVVLDTSGMRVHDLKKRVMSLFGSAESSASPMQARILSFGFKHGLPSDADLVFDVRFLDNPYFVPELRPLTGLDERVRKHVLSTPDAQRFVELTTELLSFLLPRYGAEGKSYLTIAIGCTGGQHRSVTIAIELEARLRALAIQPGSPLGTMPLRIAHRDAAVQAASATPTPPPAASTRGVRGPTSQGGA